MCELFSTNLLTYLFTEVLETDVDSCNYLRKDFERRNSDLLLNTENRTINSKRLDK